jgi:riboflavin kinase/FMN adenylyltransferase
MGAHNLPDCEIERPSAVALGFFDGVHRGHLAVIGKTLRIAREQGLLSVVFTMKNHPLSTVGNSPPSLINTFREKLELLLSTGADRVVWTDFDAAFARMKPLEFAEKILCGRLRAAAVAAGLSYSFGAGAAGNIRTLAGLGLDLGFKVFAVDPVYCGRQRISSTAIRSLITTGRVSAATRLMSRPFSIRGPVTKGRGVGKILGFPTANLAFPEEKVIPADGVYAAWAALGQSLRPAAVSIGKRPTFGGLSRSLEAHLPGFSGSLYGRELTLFLMDRIRPQEKFESPEELSSRIGRDLLLLPELLGPPGEGMDACCIEQ